jgi:glyceraldehyde-3-phosphate dehydrogenase (NADP+)
MKMFLAGDWVEADESIPVVNPFSGEEFDSVPKATAADVERALTELEHGTRTMRALSPFERGRILERAAQNMRDRVEDLARTITLEEGKILAESRVEASRAADTIALCAEEARRLTGETVPLEGAAHGKGKFGFTLRVPCGIVAAITPFNFPLNLVAHKLGPAVAGGNAVIIKPASNTPLSALKITQCFLDAGMPHEAIACITGPGGELGKAICSDERVRKISFTGSCDVGHDICRMAGMKRITMELGSNSPVIIMDDADLETAAKAVTAAGFSNAGQVCISAQRILTHQKVRGDFIDALRPHVESLTLGDPLEEATRMGPLVREGDAARVAKWIDEAVAQGARLVTGGPRSGSMCPPTILDEVTPNMKVSRLELFGPAVAVTGISDIDEAIRLANDTKFGLSAGVFTQDIDRVMRFAREVESGNIHVNWSSQWRADLMPYGGIKSSGLGKEGPQYAIKEMTEEKMIVLHLK